MARSYLVAINLNKNELQNARIQNLSSDPSSPAIGQVYFNTTDDRMKIRRDNSASPAWTHFVTDNMYDANSLLVANSDNTPIVLTVATEALVGRTASVDGGVITDLSPTEVRTLLSLSDNQIKALAGSMVTGNTETGITVTYQAGDFTFDFEVSTLNNLPAPTGSLSLNSQLITNLATPVSGTDAANKNYVDGLVNGLSWKDAVRVATTVAGTLATSFENGDTIDGVTLATGDRILIKNQAAPAENGIYTVAASGAPVRATDADIEADLLQATVSVSEGTSGGNTKWTMTTDAPITVDTTGLTWAQIDTGGVSYTAGDGLTLTGNDFDVNVDDSTIEINADTLRVKDAGITDAKLASEYPFWYSELIGDGVETDIVVTHSLGTRSVSIQVARVASPYDTVEVDESRTTTNTVTLTFAIAPSTDEYEVIIIGRP